jgi:hypothetical protein
MVEILLQANKNSKIFTDEWITTIVSAISTHRDKNFGGENSTIPIYNFWNQIKLESGNYKVLAQVSVD